MSPDSNPERENPSGPAPRRALRWVVRWVLLGTGSGVLAGLASAAFLSGLEWATRTRIQNPGMLWFLPVAGLLVGLAYHLFGGQASKGSGLLIDEIHQPRSWVPRRMAPMVAGGSVVSHLFGASVGREGTALQMSGSLTDWMARRLVLGPRERRTLLVTSLAAGFGGMFGVPFAGAMFGLEVQAIRPTRAELLRRARRIAGDRAARSPEDPVTTDVSQAAGRARARLADTLRRWHPFARMIVPVVTGAFTANLVVRVFEHHSGDIPHLNPDLDAALFAKLLVAAAVFALASALFIRATDGVHKVAQLVPWPPLRPVLGALIVLALVAAVGRDYLGLSLPLANTALIGHDTSLTIPLLKIAFTALCLGSGFVGGEVTPLFVIGATTGAAVSPVLGLDPMVGAAIGYVSVFAAAANTPIACTVMAIEVFGWGMAVPVAVAAVVAALLTGSRGIYPTQRVLTAEGPVPRTEVPPWRPSRSARSRPPGTTD